MAVYGCRPKSYINTERIERERRIKSVLYKNCWEFHFFFLLCFHRVNNILLCMIFSEVFCLLYFDILIFLFLLLFYVCAFMWFSWRRRFFWSWCVISWIIPHSWSSGIRLLRKCVIILIDYSILYKIVRKKKIVKIYIFLNFHSAFLFEKSRNCVKFIVMDYSAELFNMLSLGIMIKYLNNHFVKSQYCDKAFMFYFNWKMVKIIYNIDKV